MARGDGDVWVQVHEVAGADHGGGKDVVEGHVGGQHPPCNSQGNQDPTVDPFPYCHFPGKFQVQYNIRNYENRMFGVYLSGQVAWPMLASERRM